MTSNTDDLVVNLFLINLTCDYSIHLELFSKFQKSVIMNLIIENKVSNKILLNEEPYA